MNIRSLWQPRRLAWVAGGLVGVLLLALVGAYAVAQSSFGRAIIASRLGELLSDKTMTVRVSPPQGNLFGAFTVGDITVETSAGGRLAVTGLAVDWSPAALLRGQVRIRRIDIKQITDVGFFDAPPRSSGTSAPGVALGFPIEVGAVHIADIDLRSAVFGDRRHLSLDGSLSVAEAFSAAKVNARLARIDGGSGLAEAAIDYRADPARFAAQIKVDEPEGGLIARLAGLPAKTPLSVSVDGDGPPNKWRGKLAADAGTLANANADLVVAVAPPGVTVTVDGGTEFAALVPEHLRPVLAPRLTLHAGISYRTEGLVSLTDLRAENGVLSVQGQGRYRLADGGIDGAFDVTAKGGQTDAFGVAGLALDEGKARIALSGTAAAPVLATTVSVAAPGYGGVRAATAEGNVDVAPLEAGTWSVKGALRMDGVNTGRLVPPGMLGTALSVQFDGFAMSDGGIPHMGVTFASGDLSGSVDGAVGQDGAVDGRFTIKLARLRPALAASGIAFDGALSAQGTFDADPGFTTVHADTAGAVQQIAGGPEWVSAVLGKATSFDGAVVWQKGAAVQITKARLETALGAITATGQIDPAKETMMASYTVAVDDASRLSAVARVPLAGTVRLSGSASGAVTAPQLRAQVQIGKLSVRDVPLGDIAIGLSAAVKGAGMRADLRLGGKVRGQALGGEMALIAVPGHVQAENVALRLGKNTLSGTLGVGLEPMRLDGDLVAKLDDLSALPLQGFAPSLAGAAALRATLRSEGGQQVTLGIAANQLALSVASPDEIRSQKLTATIQVRDPFSRPAIDGKARLTGIRMTAGTIESADVSVQGTAANLNWTVAAGGNVAMPVAVSAAGRLSAADATTALTVSRFEGEAGGFPFALLAPAELRWQGEDVRLAPMALSVDNGRLDLSLSLSPQAVSGNARLQDLPAAVATLINRRIDLEGGLSGTLSLQGSRQQPLLSLVLAGRDIRPQGLSKEDFSGLTLDASLQQSASDFQAKLDITGPDDMRFSGSVRTAALIMLTDPWLRRSDNPPLSGSIAATGKLSLVDQLVGLGGDRLDGTVSAQATLSGALNRPALHGDLRLAGGAYEGVVTGVVLRNVEGHVAFTGNEARIVSLTATDGSKGTVTGSGSVAISGAEDAAGKLSVTLKQFTVLQRPEADVVASGTVALAGSLAAPRVSGALTVDSSEIRIPDQLPTSVADLNVIEINKPGGTGNKPAEAEEPSLSHALPVKLDIAIDFPGRSFVRGRGLDSEWKGKLHVGGTSAKPAITGTLNAVRGTFAFAGKTFVVKSGSVSFPGGETLEPEIDALAEVKLTDLVAQVRIQGKASQPSLTVSSDPSMPQEEVLSQILFGRSAGQLSAIQALQLAETAATLSGSGGGGIVDRIRRTLGVDVLSVQSNSDSASGATLKAGKYISDDVFLSVTQGTEPGSQQVGVEVDVLPNVSVDVNVGGSESGNVGVNWKHDY